MNVVLCETSTRESGRFNAGNKARTDALRIACEKGYEHVVLFVNEQVRIKIAAQMAVGVIRAAWRAGKGDSVLIQYPYHPDFVQSCLFESLSLARALKGFKLVVLAHDIESLRMYSGRDEALATEAKRLSCADLLICHSPEMETALKSAGLTCETAVLGPFDYLCAGSPPRRRWAENPIVDVAGNLSKEKSGYVYELQKVSGVTFELFGAGFDEAQTGAAVNLRYAGTRSSEELVASMTGQFGLVWDGPTAFDCEGPFGEYLRYNSPHKFSLYLAAGLPVIVWNQSALASLVEESGVGIAVASLEDLGTALHGVGEREYEAMVSRAKSLRDEIVCGDRLGRWL